VQVETSIAPPPNDLCSDAIMMTAGTTYSVNTVNATATGDPTPACQNSFGNGVWYSFTPAISGVVTISTCASDFDTALEVYTGACGALTPVIGGCDDDNGPACATTRASVSFSGTAGTSYLILGGGRNSESGNLQIVATVVPPPPANDQCAGAIPMTAGTTYTLNTFSATGTSDPLPSCQSGFGKGVWYTFTPSVNGVVTISTCGSDFDTALEVYEGACGALTPLIGGCDDNLGPACNSNRASVGFLGIGGTIYSILVGGHNGASGNLSIVATVVPPIANGLTIIPTFDSSILSDPQAAAIQATINYAIAVYESNFSDPVTVSITFEKVSTGLGTSSTYYQSYAYSSYRAALVSHATTADDATAIAHLPNGGSNPVNGNRDVYLHLPLARVLGFNDADPPPGESDGIISLKISIMNVSADQTDPTRYSLFAVVCHEIDEVLGLYSALNGLLNGAPSPTGPVSPEDLFRYDEFGARSFTTDFGAACYFSLDGATQLARFSQDQSGDFGDWYSPGGQTPQVQDAFAVPGAAPVLGVELQVLDTIGYKRVAPVPFTAPSLSFVKQGDNILLSWPTNVALFQLESTLAVGSAAVWRTVPSLVIGTNNVATDLMYGARKFYRLKK